LVPEITSVFNSMFMGILYVFSRYTSKGDAGFVDAGAVNSRGYPYASGAAAAATAAMPEITAMAIFDLS